MTSLSVPPVSKYMYQCPYGCGFQFEGVHSRCVGMPIGELLPMDKRIDVKRGKFGGLSPDLPGVKIDTTGKCRCVKCLCWYANHQTCDGELPDSQKIINGKMGGSSSSGSGTGSLPTGFKRVFKGGKKPTSTWVPSPIIYWLDVLRVRCDGLEQVFANREKLVDFFLNQRWAIVLSLDAKWWEVIISELSNRKIAMEMAVGKSLDVKGVFKCRTGNNYQLEALDDFDKVRAKVLELTELDLVNSWTLAQLCETYWNSLVKSGGIDIKVLQGEDYAFSRSAYYGAKQTGDVSSWRSSIADEIIANKHTYEGLLANPEADIKYKVDGNSMYPALMRGLDTFETYYPVGNSRSSQDGANEFKKGTVGMYDVKYRRPAGLKIAVLPAHRTGGIAWEREAGEGAGVYTELDIKLAMKYGYTFEFLGKCLLWDKTGHPFQTYVDNLVQARRDENDPVVRGVLKFMANTLYGKLSQGKSGDASMKEIDVDEALELMEQGVFVQDSGDKFYVSANEGKVKLNNKPNHLGAYILSWSRVRMMEFYECVGFELDANYTHTDSFRVSSENFHKLKNAGYIGEGELGLLKVEYGLVFAIEERNAGHSKIWVLKKDNTVEEILTGKWELKKDTVATERCKKGGVKLPKRK